MTRSLLAALEAGSNPLDQKVWTLAAVAKALVDLISSGQPISRQRLSRLMEVHFGASDACGAWSLREAYDALETAQVLALLDGGIELANPPSKAFSILNDLLGRLPTQTYRSEPQIDMQQFSTPVPLAFLANLAAAITPADMVLEPSAGTGLLAVFAKIAGASLLLNERDPVRAGVLAQALNRKVASHDAEFIDDLLAVDEQPSVVLINPPFARSEGRGRDRHAGARHLRSALARLAPGGRCVAIMSPAFAHDGSARSGYEAVAALVRPRVEITVQGRPFAKHGTSISVRLIIYDKGWTGSPDRLTVNSLDDLLPHILALPPRLFDDGPPEPSPEQARPRVIAPAARPTVRPLFASGTRPPMPRPKPRPVVAVDGMVEPLSYSVRETPLPAGEQIGIYVPWRLSRMDIPQAKPHPDQLVESIAMSSIIPPRPTYVPMLPRCAVTALSDAQLETIIYAGQAFERDLPGLHAPNGSGTLLTPDAHGVAYRMGYFIGDGTGVGKGQQVAGCILDQWSRGRRKAVWISKSAALIEDARRDWAALGGLPIDIQPLDAFAFGAPIAMESGIIFLTYATLRSQRYDEASRLHQLLAWLEADFEGVICFDEAHEMANAAGTETQFGTQKGSEQGLAGVRLQNLRPRARILYVSATGATDPANLCYAIRLGLWGPGTSFDDRAAFMGGIEKGGIAAMEIVARDLKALGLYTARALTFSGVEYDPLEHPLTPGQIEVYNAYADGWQVIHAHLDEVLALTNIVDRMENKALNARAKGAALSRFESAKQRFFAQLLIAMKVPSLIAAITQEVEAGHHAIVQLVTTAEAMLDRRLASLSADERAHLDIELSPSAAMVDYLKTAFPVRMMKIVKGSDDVERSELMIDEHGNPVFCQQALALRDEMIEQLCSLPPIGLALDELIRHFGTDRIAEVTGRSRRLVHDATGRQRVERRGGRSNLVEAESFMSGAKPILVFSDAGGTGRSYHADRNSKSADRRRIHFLLEPGWRASNAIQGLGRSNRTNQMSAPVFRPVTTDCRGERRFISTIARRLDSLGALTRGQRQTGGQNLFDPSDNLESDYARDALNQWYHLLYRGKLTSTSFKAFVDMTGLKLIDKDSGGLVDDLPPIQRWLNRLLALRIETQNAIFEEYMALIQARIDAARDAGTLDVGVETIQTERTVLLDEQLLCRDPVTGAETRLSRLELHYRRRATGFAQLMREHGNAPVSWLRNGRSGRVALQRPSWSIMDGEGNAIPMWELIRPTSRERIRDVALKESHWAPIDGQEFEALWNAEVEEARARIDIETINMATGLLLPVWNRLPDDDLRVWRVSDAQGNSILGRIISPSGVEKVTKSFGVDMAITLSPAEMIAGARNSEGVSVPGMDATRLIWVHVNGSRRLELRDFPPARRDWLKSIGCFTEVIQYKTRMFIPADRASTIVDQLVRTGTEWNVLIASGSRAA
ncbi:methylase [Sphingobium sp. 22B]|uniref:strawberry notch-like NTP hydrolase domain-containing protein n=2 Tax=unclassified Sphingobium TaxID=2611147 RepID=UPI00078629DD|nr:MULTISPECIES: strawberry notch family protein [unclassified Sphingobium]KXU33068.1 methylase [Sphingobium sp. AM]KYC33932.1 methylase [Sphingobium sp. 22B]OAP32278.1 methylase [Sphingobium sp. 20006FA]